MKDVDRQQRLSELAKAIDNLCYFGTEYQDLKRKDFYAYGFRVTIGKSVYLTLCRSTFGNLANFYRCRTNKAMVDAHKVYICTSSDM